MEFHQRKRALGCSDTIFRLTTSPDILPTLVTVIIIVMLVVGVLPVVLQTRMAMKDNW